MKRFFLFSASLVALTVAAGMVAGPPAPKRASVERYACEQATRLQLRDPGSYQRIEFREVGSDRALLTFRARNGFGGYAEGAATCTAEGSSVLER